MRKRYNILAGCILLVCSFVACYSGEEVKAQDTVQEENKYPSYYKLKDMPEISVEGNVVTVVLLQDIPLPYRWAITGQSEYATLIDEYEVEDPSNGSLFSSGSAQEFHVFVFELVESDVAELVFYNLHVTDPENLTEANGSRKFTLEYVNGQWKIQGNIM